MNAKNRFIWINRKSIAHTFSMGKFSFMITFVFVLMMGTAVYIGFVLGTQNSHNLNSRLEFLQYQINDHLLELDNIRYTLQDNLDASATRLAQLQARLTRLDSLGERLVDLGKLDKNEFDFQRVPAMGGADVSPYEGETVADIELLIAQLAIRIETRQHQLTQMERVIHNQQILQNQWISGRPAKRGWITSRYGMRIDPISGRNVMHRGMDFGAAPDSEVIAVASGIVIFAKHLRGYGNRVDIKHHGGYTTVYAHNKSLAVDIGDVVKKGQTIAYIGSTGRSTGPHVHYEVLKDGKRIDPDMYVQRKFGE